MGRVKILKSGLYTSIQDLGRQGFRKYGVPVSGAMDQRSAKMANLLVNNPEGHPVIEITLSGPEVRFTGEAKVAITGADLEARLESRLITLNQAFSVENNQIVSFGRRIYGCRAYLAISGLQAENTLGSSSQFRGVTQNATLEKGDELKFIDEPMLSQSGAKIKIDPEHFNVDSLDVYAGPEFDSFEESLTPLFGTHLFEIGENNRMGYQFRNVESLKHVESIITSQVVPGTIQLTPSGRLIALMRDAQVTGGYPRVLQLTEEGINRLSQKVQGERISFRLVLY